MAVVLVNPLTSRAASMFGERRAYPAGTSPVGVVAAELDGQPGLDIATADEGGTITLLSNRGDGVFAAGGQIDLDPRYAPAAIAPGRFNADAIGDLAVAANDSGSANFVGSTLVFRSVAVAQYAVTPVAVGLFPTCIVSADLTGDGIADLTTCSSNPLGGGLISILRGRADFSFTPPVSVPLTGIIPQSLAVGDVDRDGQADLVIADMDGDGVWILYGIGEPRFDAPVRIGVVNKPSAVALATFASGGAPSIVVASSMENDVVVFQQTQPRSFAAGVPYAVGQEPVDLASSDVDGDGVVDVLVANASSDTVSIMLGNPQSSLTLGQTVPVGDRPVAIALGDFNGDGKIDFATADQNDVEFGADTQSVSVVLNGVSPPFTATPSPTLHSTPTATATASARNTPTTTGTRRTATSTPRPTPTPAGPLDANCDGRLDDADLDTLLARIFDGQSGCLTRRVTAADVTELIKTLGAAH